MSPLDRQREDDEPEAALAGVSLEERVCATCRRPLRPWETRCPEDGGAAVALHELAARPDPLLARFLDEPEESPGS